MHCDCSLIINLCNKLAVSLIAHLKLRYIIFFLFTSYCTTSVPLICSTNFHTAFMFSFQSIKKNIKMHRSETRYVLFNHCFLVVRQKEMMRTELRIFDKTPSYLESCFIIYRKITNYL